MNTEKNILVAFILNVSFSVFELVGGIFTNSVAIISDAVHDFGDAVSIGLSYFLEKKSKKKPNDKYTYGYLRYSILGALITTSILALGSGFVICGGINRLLNPVEINYDGMIVFAIFGVAINFAAAFFTRSGDSVNQKAVNLHMLEDVFGWVVVLIGSILMRFTDISMIDSIMSIGVAIYILVHTFSNFKEIIDLFLVKTPSGISLDEMREHLCEIDGVNDVHHIHVWSLDGINNYATMHVTTNKKNSSSIKDKVREELEEFGIGHVTIEIEDSNDNCSSKECEVKDSKSGRRSHHHHHH